MDETYDSKIVKIQYEKLLPIIQKLYRYAI